MKNFWKNIKEYIKYHIYCEHWIIIGIDYEKYRDGFCIKCGKYFREKGN